MIKGFGVTFLQKIKSKILEMPDNKSTKQQIASPRKKVLAIASRGGHWIQLLRLRPAFSDCDMTYVTTDPSYRAMVDGENFCVVTEANRFQKLKLLLMVIQMFTILLRLRPDVIVTTGAAPGYIAIRLGKWFRARTLWIDSIANAEELSLSGRLALKYADMTLTQWEHLSGSGGVEYHGAVI